MKNIKYFCFLLIVVIFSACSKEQNNTAISSDGLTIKYDIWGEGDIALVFVHGLACDRTYWDKQVVYFSKSYKMVAIDLIGHGNSDIGREEYTMAAFGQDVKSVVEKLKLKKVILIGHSMGANVILEAAQIIPDRLVGLIGVDGISSSTGASKEWIDSFLEPFRVNCKEAMDNLVRLSMFTPDSDSIFIEKIASNMANAPEEVTLGEAEEYFKHDNIKLLQNINAPILSINKTRDIPQIEKIRKLQPDFDVKTISNVGHFIMMEKPEEFNDLLQECIKQLVQAQNN